MFLRLPGETTCSRGNSGHWVPTGVTIPYERNTRDMRVAHGVYGDYRSSENRLCQLIWLQWPPQSWSSAPTCPQGAAEGADPTHMVIRRGKSLILEEELLSPPWPWLLIFFLFCGHTKLSLGCTVKPAGQCAQLHTTNHWLGTQGTCQAFERAKQTPPAEFPSSSSECAREREDISQSSQLPKQQVAFHGWMTKTANEAYHSTCF